MKRYKSFFEEISLSILPIGNFNLSTGSSKYFNVYENWDKGTAEVWISIRDGVPRFIFTSSEKPLYKIGTRKSFKHDQTRKFLFDAELVDFAKLSDIKTKLSKYGKVVRAYVYK